MGVRVRCVSDVYSFDEVFYDNNQMLSFLEERKGEIEAIIESGKDKEDKRVEMLEYLWYSLDDVVDFIKCYNSSGLFFDDFFDEIVLNEYGVYVIMKVGVDLREFDLECINKALGGNEISLTSSPP